MPTINTGLAQVSNDFLLVALVAYSLAVLAFAGDFAFGHGKVRVTGAAAKVKVPAMAGVATAGIAGADAGRPPTTGAEVTDGPASLRNEESSSLITEGAKPSATRAGRWVRAALVATFFGLAAHLVGVISRGLAVHRLPWGDMYEFVVALTCVAVIFFLGLMIRYRAYYLGLFVVGAVVIALGLAQTVIYTAAGPLVPALQSYWLSIHVTAITLAVGTYFVAAVLGIVYLFAVRHARRAAAGRVRPADGIMGRLPAPDVFDRLAYRTVMFAFPLWTFGIIAGAIWADQAWGRYWGWDPTETWAFITWVVYACFLHARSTAGWRGWKATVIQLTAFCCLLFNMVGVSLFITGLHSYAGLN
ncbi:MAG TPA: c-type cytochrome biogenesis protein CcsB [Streptosporangiaceae bacterium]|jgi:cytochrome c-type biogenesis protein CcsB|nr:c-type cytochrome biogenesis protein CcsB [Streptosporangiaceae bacterium]